MACYEIEGRPTSNGEPTTGMTVTGRGTATLCAARYQLVTYEFPVSQLYQRREHGSIRQAACTGLKLDNREPNRQQTCQGVYLVLHIDKIENEIADKKGKSCDDYRFSQTGTIRPRRLLHRAKRQGTTRHCRINHVAYRYAFVHAGVSQVQLLGSCSVRP